MPKFACTLCILLYFFALSIFADRPNVIMIVTDEEMVIPPEWKHQLEPWYKEHMPAHNYFRRKGISFANHHGSQLACPPARSTIYTGHYGGITGVTQTDGLGKTEEDPKMTWLEENTVPTIGNFLLAAGYDMRNILYTGKFHLKNLDIVDENKIVLPTVNLMSQPIQSNVNLYHQQHRLKPYGFSSRWIGPEPHGGSRVNSGGVRDPNFIDQAIDIIRQKTIEYNLGVMEPFFLTINLVNPHDIVLAIGLWMHGNLKVHPSVPELFGAEETLVGILKEALVHHVYRDVYRQMYSEHEKVEEFYNTEEGRMRIVRFYYSLLKKVNTEIMRLLEVLEQAPFFDNTYVFYTSDHGDLLGRSMRFQKWHSLESRITHVPFYVAHPSLHNLDDKDRVKDIYTSHADIVPTLLGLLNIKEEDVAPKLKQQFSKVHHLVGKDQSPIIRLEEVVEEGRIVYSISQDNVSDGENRISKLTGFKPDENLFPGVEFPPTEFPVISGRSHVEAIRFMEGNHRWAFHRYYDPTNPSDEEFFLYDAEVDPLEVINLVEEDAELFTRFKNLLQEQREYHLYPPSW